MESEMCMTDGKSWTGQKQPDSDADNISRQEYLAELMDHAAHYIRRGLSSRGSQGKILRILDRDGSMTQQQLQSRLDIKSSSMSEILTKLETSGFIVRKRDETDRRRCIIEITDAGREDQKEHAIARRRQMTSLYDGLDEEDQEEMIRILLKLQDSWKEMRMKEGGN